MIQPWNRNVIKKRAKYGNRKVTVDNITFDSAKEARTYQDLKILFQAGELQALEPQKRFELLPIQREGKKIIEKPLTYVADFYVVRRDGTKEVIDVKSPPTRKLAAYIIKRKLMLWIHGIRVKEL